MITLFGGDDDEEEMMRQQSFLSRSDRGRPQYHRRFQLADLHRSLFTREEILVPPPRPREVNLP